MLAGLFEHHQFLLEQLNRTTAKATRWSPAQLARMITMIGCSPIRARAQSGLQMIVPGEASLGVVTSSVLSFSRKISRRRPDIAKDPMIFVTLSTKNHNQQCHPFRIHGKDTGRSHDLRRHWCQKPSFSGSAVRSAYGWQGLNKAVIPA